MAGLAGTIGPAAQARGRAPLPGAAKSLSLLPPEGTSRSLDAVRAALERHVGVAGAPDAGPAQISALGDLDRAIYAHFEAANRTRLSEVPHADHLVRLLQQSESEHASLVDELPHNQIPVELDRLPVGYRRTATQLWRQIRSGRGGVQLAGPDDFQRSMRGHLAKLLATPTGVEMLHQLGNLNPADRTVTIRNSLRPGWTPKPGEQEPADSSYAVPSDSVFDDKTNALREVPQAGPNYASLAGPEDLLGAIRQRAPGVISGGQAYQFGQGTAVDVVMKPHHPHPLEGHKLAGQRGEEILNPTHITLGHELGHALKMTTGAYTPHMGFDRWDALTPGEQAVYGGRAEEWVNITSIENSLRRESGVSVRRGHKTQAGIEAIDRRSALDEIPHRLGVTPRNMEYLPQWSRYIPLKLQAKAQATDTAAFNQVKQQLDDVVNTITPEQVADAEETGNAVRAADEEATRWNRPRPKRPTGRRDP
jgi:hypothetical protein